MNKKIFIIIIQILCIRQTYAQNFFPLPPGFNFPVRSLYYDDSTNELYAGGNFFQLANGTPMNGISHWNGTNWDSLGYEFYGAVLTIAKYNGFIYAGGSCSIIDSTGNYVASYFGYWNGNNWAIPSGGGANSAIWELYVNGNDLYVGGAFDTINGLPADGIARFDGVSWYTYPSLNSTFHYINAIALYNNELYIGGNFNAGVGKNDILKYDGTNWVSVGGGFTGANTWVNAFEIFQNKLYVGGYFQTSNGDPGNNIAMWDGTFWSQPANGVMPSNVFTLKIFNNQLFVGGQINNASGIPVTFIAKWDGNNWNNLGSNFDNSVGCFTSHGNDLFIGGGFLSIDGDTMNYITRYSPSLGIHENAWNTSGITIAPNPNNGNFSLTSLFYPIESIRLFDFSGRVVFSNSKVLSNSYECKLNAPDGIYIAEVFINGRAYRSKMVVTQ